MAEGARGAAVNAVPEAVRAAAARLEALRAQGAPALTLAHAGGALKRAEREAGVTASGAAFEESETAVVGNVREAVAAMCRACIVDPGAAGSAAVQVELCTDYGCPLWRVRPVRTGERAAYSAPVVAELGLTGEQARWRHAHPRRRPPWAGAGRS